MSDPLRLWRELDNIQSNFDQTLSLMQRMAGMSVDELLALLDDTDTLGASDRQAAGAMLLGRIAELDPARAIERARAGPGQYRNAWLHAVFHSLSRVDQEAAIRAAEGLSAAERSIAARAMVLSIQDRDPGIRTAVIDRLQVSNIYPVNPRTDPAGAWRDAVGAGGLTNQQRLYGILGIWAQQDPLAALQAVEEADALASQAFLRQQILSTWARDDPHATVDWLLDSVDGVTPNESLDFLYQQLSQSDPGAAERLLSSLSGEALERAERAAAISSVGRDPVGSVRWLLEQEIGAHRSSAAQEMLYELADDESGAIAFIDSLPADLQSEMHVAWTGLLANQNLTAAVRYLEDIRDPVARASASRDLISRSAYSNPQFAMDFIADLPTAQRPELYQTLVSVWTHRDKASALSFTESLRGRSFDGAAVSIIESQSQDLTTSMALMRRINDKSLRRRAASTVYRVLTESDPQAAEAFREEEGLPALMSRGG
ncbi:MAG: hypothetical protein AAF515_10865 [Pseudomonadota bacterium]